MIRKLFFSFLLSVLCVQLSKSQTVTTEPFDRSLQVLTDDLATKLSKTNYGSLKMGVWDLTDLNGGTSPIGQYIAEDISSNLSERFHLTTRNKLNTLLKENQLAAEGFINQATLKQVKKLSDIDVIITGTISVLPANIKVTLQALNSDGDILAASKGDVPRNADVNELLGVNTGASNRGFNRPLSSNEQLNNPQTVNNDCANRHVGDYCFSNSSKYTLSIYVSYNIFPKDYRVAIRTGTNFILKPGESKCVNDIYVDGPPNTFTANRRPDPSQPFLIGSDALVDQGDFKVEQCKSKTYQIK